VGTNFVCQWAFTACFLPHVCTSVNILAYDRYSTQTGHGWKTWYIIFLLVLSIILLGLFVCIEHVRGDKAMMPLAIWKNPQFSLIMAVLFFGWFDFEIVTLYMTFL